MGAYQAFQRGAPSARPRTRIGGVYPRELPRGTVSGRPRQAAVDRRVRRVRDTGEANNTRGYRGYSTFARGEQLPAQEGCATKAAA
ncbi:hypothetical protein PGTUg99_009238 [Puccinia graminis f. sp. tritici]|uniref:Uncharacterized protein n=1 Tax=Puccinia graminis f. sp. tritici TaxID=56615 RepID=A0A5B0PD97_PUCGR|nr:hypothetical protein PGTUg99_009238 [Puccinia graminis f. sp. tritici]